jgi:hypothetical protein
MAPASFKHPLYLTRILANIASAYEALEELRGQVRQSIAFNEAACVELEKAQNALVEARRLKSAPG